MTISRNLDRSDLRRFTAMVEGLLQAVLAQYAIEPRAGDAEYLGGPRFVASGRCEDTLHVCALERLERPQIGAVVVSTGTGLDVIEANHVAAR